MPEPKRPLKVFLCHAHADRDPVRGLYTRLTKDGVDAWLDKEKLLPGQDWELEIRKAVRESDVVVVCLSCQFSEKGFRQKEVRIALEEAALQPEGEIFIIPARFEECEPPESLHRYHWVDLFEDDGYERLMRALRARSNNIGAILQLKQNWFLSITPPRQKSKELFERKNSVVAEKDKLEETPNHKKTESEEIEKDAEEKREAAEKLTQEKIEKEYRRKREKIIRDANRQKILTHIRYRLTLVRLYSLPILLGTSAIALLVYLFYFMPPIIPLQSPIATSTQIIVPQPILTSTVEIRPIATKTPLIKEAKILYHIDFEPPSYTNGSKPIVGTGVNFPSKIMFGEPLVMSSFLPITSQCLVFNTIAGSDGYEQIRFDMNYGYTFYNLSFDLATQRSEGSYDGFIVFFDYSVDHPTYDDYNRVIFSTSGSYQGQDKVLINTNEKYYISIDVDFSTRMIMIYLNNQLAKEMELINGSDIQYIRFSITEHDPQIAFAVDNIQISGK